MPRFVVGSSDDVCGVKMIPLTVTVSFQVPGLRSAGMQ